MYKYIMTNLIIDWYKEEMIKPKYLGKSDEDMVELTGKYIKKMRKQYPYNNWEEIVKEVAEKILDEDEWSITHYDIEDILMESSGLM